MNVDINAHGFTRLTSFERTDIPVVDHTNSEYVHGHTDRTAAALMLMSGAAYGIVAANIEEADKTGYARFVDCGKGYRISRTPGLDGFSVAISPRQTSGGLTR